MARTTTAPSLPFAIAALLACGGCAALDSTGDIASSPDPAESAQPQMTTVTVFDFEDGQIPPTLQGSNAGLSIVSDSGGHALRAELGSAANPYTKITLRPAKPLDLTGHAIAGIAFDMQNPGSESVQVNVDIVDGKGQAQTRSSVVPAGGGGSFFAELAGPDISVDTGLRDNPKDWLIDGYDLAWMWGTRQLDLSQITEINLVTQMLASDRTLIIDNLRVIFDPPRNRDYLKGIVDPYGQMATALFPEKVTSDEDLRDRAVAELAGLRSSPMPGRSRWQGWTGGPRLEATGYFHTGKIGNKWTLVDPDGYPYFATGVDNIRMTDTATMTGNEFRHEFRSARDPDGAPEDSANLNRLPDSALEGRYVASEPRREMFSWLPPYDGALGSHYGYRSDVIYGPLKSGETYSFYRANLERKYGDDGDRSYLDQWREVTKARMIDWGFTSYGNWLDPSFFDDPGVPFFAHGWINGSFETVSTGADYWAPMPDPYDPQFAAATRETIRKIAGEVKGSPWCVGVFIENEKSWGRPEQPETRYSVVINTLKRDARNSPAKAAFTSQMQAKYKTIAALNAGWGTSISSWEAFAEGVDLQGVPEGRRADYSAMLSALADKYYGTVDQILNEMMPNHMYLGSRFATWGMSPEVIAAAARHVDVLSFNIYSEVPHPTYWDFLKNYDKPVIIGEFHMGAVDGPIYHPGIVWAADARDRARMYRQYMDRVITNPQFVGAHWFQYIDSPLTGRSLDGENYQVGFVTTADIPYETMVEAAKEMNRTLYDRRFNQ